MVGLEFRSLPDGYAMLMSANKDETAVLSCHSSENMAVRMCKVLDTPL